MRTRKTTSPLVTLLTSTTIAALLAGAPVTLRIDADAGAGLYPAQAFAKGDNSGSGSDSSGSGSGGDRDRDRDRDRSSDDNSGSGSSGSGSDDDSSGHGDGDDDDVADDNSGRGRGGDDRADGPKVEIEGGNIEITYADGTKEEIENGVYERKDASGRTVEERPATQADFDRMASAASSGDLDGSAGGGSGGGTGGTGGVTKIEVSANGVEVTYADGTKEEIANGIYERKDASGRTVEERPATQADFDRLAAATGGAAGGGNAPGTPGAPGTAEREFRLADGTKIEVAGDKIEVSYADGWKEEIEGGRYEMKDPAGNTVVERPATPADRERLAQQIPG